MTRKLYLAAAAALGLSIICSAVSAKLLVRKSGAVVTPIEKGFTPRLQQWSPGRDTPDWTLELRGANVSARSAVADMKELPNGNVLLVERWGDVVLVSPDGDEIFRKPVVYPSVEIQDLQKNMGEWEKHVVDRGRTSAAWITDTHALLASDRGAMVFVVPIAEILASQAEMLFLGDFWHLTNKEGSEAIAIWHELRNVTSEVLMLGEEEERPVTAVAVCKNTIISGHKDGTITFKAYPKAEPDEERIRRLEADEKEIKQILDLGCLNAQFAYSITFEGAHGQAQLWDLSTQALSDEFGADTRGHPGAALSGVASQDGSHLMTVGDFDVRVWKVSSGGFTFVARHFLRERGATSYSGAVLPNGDFVTWDGQRLWQVPTTGGDPILYAGPAKDLAE